MRASLEVRTRHNGILSGAARSLVTLFCAAALPAVLLPGDGRASGYEFDGVGARNVARGGAVIADAADWTAVYWNPANLVSVPRREAGLELRGGGMVYKDGNSFNTPFGNPFAKTKERSSFFYGSAGMAVPLDDRSALGAGIYTPLLQGASFKEDAVPSSVVYKRLDYKSHVVLAVGNISYARKMSDKLSAAAGLNVLYAQLETDAVNELNLSPYTFTADRIHQKIKGDGAGLEGVFGMKYLYSDTLSFGAIFRTGSRFKIKGDASASSTVLPAEETDFEFKLKHPATSGAGVTWRAAKALKLSCDVTQTWWRGFSNKTTYDNPGTMLRNSANTYSWRNSVRLKTGGVYNYGDNTDILFGYSVDTWAIDRKTVDFSTAIDVPMHRFSAGVSRRWTRIEGTLAGLAGTGSRKSGGVKYHLAGWYLMSELKYSF